METIICPSPSQTKYRRRRPLIVHLSQSESLIGSRTCCLLIRCPTVTGCQMTADDITRSPHFVISCSGLHCVAVQRNRMTAAFSSNCRGCPSALHVHCAFCGGTQCACRPSLRIQSGSRCRAEFFVCTFCISWSGFQCAKFSFKLR